LENQEPGAGSEIQLTDAISKLNQLEAVYAYNFFGKRYDVGEKIGYIKTTIDYALQRAELRSELLEYLEQVINQNSVGIK